MVFIRFAVMMLSHKHSRMNTHNYAPIHRHTNACPHRFACTRWKLSHQLALPLRGWFMTPQYYYPVSAFVITDRTKPREMSWHGIVNGEKISCQVVYLPWICTLEGFVSRKCQKKVTCIHGSPMTQTDSGILGAVASLTTFIHHQSLKEAPDEYRPSTIMLGITAFEVSRYRGIMDGS